MCVLLLSVKIQREMSCIVYSDAYFKVVVIINVEKFKQTTELYAECTTPPNKDSTNDACDCVRVYLFVL